LCESFKGRNENMVEGPRVAGVSAFKDIGMTIRLVGSAKPLTNAECEMNLRREIKKVLNEENIKMPNPKHLIMKGE
jgi:small conductance mechanosensitive channel